MKHTLMDEAWAWWAWLGWDIPSEPTTERQMYETWAVWAFSDLHSPDAPALPLGLQYEV